MTNTPLHGAKSHPAAPGTSVTRSRASRMRSLSLAVNTRRRRRSGSSDDTASGAVGSALVSDIVVSTPRAAITMTALCSYALELKLPVDPCFIVIGTEGRGKQKTYVRHVDIIPIYTLRRQHSVSGKRRHSPAIREPSRSRLITPRDAHLPLREYSIAASNYKPFQAKACYKGILNGPPTTAKTTPLPFQTSDIASLIHQHRAISIIFDSTRLSAAGLLR